MRKECFAGSKSGFELLIPETQVGGKTIEFDKHAKKRLKELEEDTTPKFDPDQRLTQTYQRLWDLNSTLDSEFVGDIRTRLFQLVQVAAEPLNTEALTAILRIRTGDYEDYPTADIVKGLFANFLEEYDASPDSQDPEIQLRFIHESAREFVINSCRPSGDVGCSKTWRQTYAKQSHLSIVRVYIDAFASHAHPIWQPLLGPRKWGDVILNHQFRMAWALDADPKPQWYAFEYLASNGFYHCTLAANKRSLFNPLWQKVLDRVILSSESAFGMIIVKPTLVKFLDPVILNPMLRQSLQNKVISVTQWPLIRREHGRFEILPAHLLAILNIIHEDDLEVPYDTSDTGATSTANNYHVIRRSLFQHADNTGFFMPREIILVKPLKATALQLACATGTCAAARMIFQAARPYCDDPLKSLLLNESLDCNVPLGIAIEACQFDLARTLLELERSATSSNDFNADLPSSPKFVSKQWSCRIIRSDGRIGFRKSLLFCAWEIFKDSKFCQLLELAQPVNSNASDEDGRTLLHRAAAHGNRMTVCVLVDMCGAKPDAKTNHDLTPAIYAAAAGHEGVVADLRAGADTEAEIPAWYFEVESEKNWVFDPYGAFTH